MSEQKIQRQIENWLDDNGWFVYKIMSATIAGIPDLIAHKDSKTMYVEVKTISGRLSRVQQYRIAQLRSIGIEVYINDNLQQFIKDLNEK